MNICPGDLSDPRVIDLLHFHLSSAREQTAPGSAHALDVSGLQSREIDFWTLWNEESLVGFGALKTLSPDHGEVKSMHVVTAMRGTGAGSALLCHIIAAAREKQMTRLSLETGSWEYFKPARSLYRKHGFIDCEPFANYRLDPNSVFMMLDLK